jgi:beta-galactosidase
MKHLLSKKYFPFGSQYYRAPSPHKNEWERDLKNMAAYGFNTVKFWVQWRWNNPSENKFYFDDIDELMDLAQKFKLRVMLNTIFDVAPAWIYTKYDDASMITLNGREIGPQTQPHRQIGGLGYCFNNDKVTEHQFKFLRETIKRYKNHPALEIWNVGSEPELTSSIAEMRVYADNAEKIGDMLCYCDNCKNKFRQWLGNKYKKPDKLNEVWNRNYNSFDEAEIPFTRNTFNDIIDWRMFFVHTIGENVRQRFEIANEEDNGKHPLMCHHVFIQGFPVTSTANDPWNVGQYGDLHGFTQMDDAAMIDILRSCAKDKPVISAEMLMLYGYTLNLPKKINENDIKRIIFSGIAGNLKGFIFWQYRPEILGREAPAWGLTYPDGSETPWLKSFSKVGKVLQEHSDFLLDAKPSEAEVAILYNPENQVFAWASTGNEKNATNSLLGVHKALYEHNFIVDFIHPKEFKKNILDNYKVLYIPFPYYLSEEICKAIEKWVSGGGVLIGEAYFAGWNAEHGHHEKIIPGYGLDKVFKIKQGTVGPVSAADNSAEIKLIRDLPYIKKQTKVFGSIVKETFFVEGAKILAKFKSGEPAITYSDYGKGKAIQIGTYLGLGFYNDGIESNGELIASLAEHFADIKKSVSNKKVRVDLLERNKNAMLIIQNLDDKKNYATVKLLLQEAKTFTELFTGEKIRSVKQKGKIVISLELKKKEVKVYFV